MLEYDICIRYDAVYAVDIGILGGMCNIILLIDFVLNDMGKIYAH